MEILNYFNKCVFRLNIFFYCIVIYFLHIIQFIIIIGFQVILPDLELFVNLGDWPISSTKNNFPIFSWCNSYQTMDIVMPTYDITESSLENMGRYNI